MTGDTSSYVANAYQSVQRGMRRGWENSRRVGFSGLNVVYDEEAYDYRIDDEGRIYVPLDSYTVSETENLENAEN